VLGEQPGELVQLVDLPVLDGDVEFPRTLELRVDPVSGDRVLDAVEVLPAESFQ